MTRPAHLRRPPMRDGVSASCVALLPGHWATLLDFLCERLPAVTRADWQQRMDGGRVIDEAGRSLPVSTPCTALRPGQRIYYYRELAHEPRIPFEATIVYRDDHLLVADKPHFLPVTPGGRYVQETLLVRLKKETGCEDLTPLHRLDRETAGLVLFSLKAQDRDAYQRLFRDQLVNKVYEAIAPLRAELPLPATYRSRIEPDDRFFRQREVPGEPNAETTLRLLETRGSLGRYELKPSTGRMHQLRVHMNALGRPICGDLFYPEVVHGPGTVEEDWNNPLRLLARELQFIDPLTGQDRVLRSTQSLHWPRE